MRPFDRHTAQAVITSSFAWVALAATIGAVSLLLTTAAEFGATAGTHRDPLSLFAITKSPLSDGATQVTMALLPNFGLFLAGAALAAAGLALVRMRLR
jgi:hypothetical protein